MNTFSKLLQEEKKLNIPRLNLIYKDDLEKTIKDTIIKYKEIIFCVDSPIFIECLSELRKQQVIDEIVYQEIFMEDTVRKLAWKNIVADD